MGLHKVQQLMLMLLSFSVFYHLSTLPYYSENQIPAQNAQNECNPTYAIIQGVYYNWPELYRNRLAKHGFESNCTYKVNNNKFFKPVCQKYNYKSYGNNAFCNGGRVIGNGKLDIDRHHHFKSKLGLHRILTSYCNKYHSMDNVCNFQLLSYDMSDINDRIDFLNQNINCNEIKSKTWVFKEWNRHQGKGVHLINDPQVMYQLIVPQKQKYKPKINSNCININMNNKTDINYINYMNFIKAFEHYNHKRGKLLKNRQLKHLIIQEFVANPLLINQKRFHSRSYFIIPSFKNPFIVLHHLHKVGFFLNPSVYDVEKDVSNKYAVITNEHFHPNHKLEYFNMDQIQKYFKNKNNYTNKLNDDLIHILKNVFTANSYYNKINKVKTDFVNENKFHANIDSNVRLYCMDTLINDQFELKLLEINYGCGLWEVLGHEIDTKNLINDTIDVMLEIHQKRIDNVPIQSIDSLGHFKIAFWEN